MLDLLNRVPALLNGSVNLLFEGLLEIMSTVPLKKNFNPSYLYLKSLTLPPPSPTLFLDFSGNHIHRFCNNKNRMNGYTLPIRGILYEMTD